MLYDIERDDTRLGRGLGMIQQTTVVEDTDAGGYTPYVEVSSSDPGTDSTYEVPDSAIRTLSDVSPTMLPALSFATGTASCVDCDTSTANATATTAPAAAATAAATAAAVVTPLPAAPTTVNWLLIVAGLGLGYALLKSGPAPALGSAPEPAVQENLGRTPRKPKPGLKHVDTLEM